MKIEFCKDVKPDVTTYFTRIDGVFIAESFAIDEQKARANYEFMKTHGGVLAVEEVIEWTEI